MYLGLICTIKGVAGPGSLVNMRVRVMRYVVRKRERERESRERRRRTTTSIQTTTYTPFLFRKQDPLIGRQTFKSLCRNSLEKKLSMQTCSDKIFPALTSSQRRKKGRPRARASYVLFLACRWGTRFREKCSLVRLGRKNVPFDRTWYQVVGSQKSEGRTSEI